MANHGFVTTRKKLTGAQVDKDIREIAERRFGDIFEIEGPDVFDDKKTQGWTFTVKDTESVKRFWGFQVWLSTPRKLEFRHPVGEFLWWAQVCVMTDELAVRYNGAVSDEGVSGRWKGNPAKYPTFQSWFDARYEMKHWVKGEREKMRDALQQMKRIELEHLPPIIRKFVDSQDRKTILDELVQKPG